MTFLDSSGVRALLNCHEYAARRGCALEISQAHSIVHQVLALTSLLDMFNLSAA